MQTLNYYQYYKRLQGEYRELLDLLIIQNKIKPLQITRKL